MENYPVTEIVFKSVSNLQEGLSKKKKNDINFKLCVRFVRVGQHYTL